MLGVQYCGLGLHGLINIANHATSLEKLLIDGNRIDEEVIDAIVNLKWLNELHATDTDLTERMLLRMAAELPHLTWVFTNSNSMLIQDQARWDKRPRKQ